MRTQCQAVNLGSSLLILGLLVPVFTRLKTQKNHKKDLLAQQNVNNNGTTTTPQNHVDDRIKNISTNMQSNSTFTAFKKIATESK